MSHKDWRGTPIEVGSTVIYPVSQGSSSAFVREGKVLEFVKKEDRYSFSNKAYWQARVEVTRTAGAHRGKLSRPTLIFVENLTVIP